MSHLGAQKTGQPHRSYSAAIYSDTRQDEIKSSERQHIERIIADKYIKIHNAQLKEYLPLLLGLRCNGNLVGAVGIRPGMYRPMFLEQYLDSPIEQQVAALSNQPVDRYTLAEIGNFAIESTGYGPLLMALTAAVLVEAGYKWMVFTATVQVERLIRRRGFNPRYLQGADPDRLSGDKSLWGSYYTNNPRVMVGRLEFSPDLVEKNAELCQWILSQYGQISGMVGAIKEYCDSRSE